MDGNARCASHRHGAEHVSACLLVRRLRRLHGHVHVANVGPAQAVLCVQCERRDRGNQPTYFIARLIIIFTVEILRACVPSRNGKRDALFLVIFLCSCSLLLDVPSEPVEGVRDRRNRYRNARKLLAWAKELDRIYRTELLD